MAERIAPTELRIECCLNGDVARSKLCRNAHQLWHTRAHVSSSHPIQRSIGRYALCGEIARGGMATVHLGRLIGPIGFSRTVAIKKLHPQYAKDPEFTAMLLDEARLAVRISHPNVVSILDVVPIEDGLYLVMEYVHGEAFGRLLKNARQKGFRVSPHITISVIAGALHGLHAAHEAKSELGKPLGIVHRDISPQNIMVGVDGVARVLDFGIAKAAVRAQSTRQGQVKGKLPYMSPEQLRFGDVDRRTDLYAVAVVLWESITGRRLFSGSTDGQTLKMILNGQVDPPSTLMPGLPEALDQAVMRGLSRDASQRFATAKEMAIALERILAPATASEVGEWVEANAGEMLGKRAQLVADTECASSGAYSAANVPTPDTTPESLRATLPNGKLRVDQIRSVAPAPVPAPSLGPAAVGSAPKRTWAIVLIVLIAFTTIVTGIVVILALGLRLQPGGPATTGATHSLRVANDFDRSAG
jgi:eukaryotic-like serine/threonine-protein kinase